MNTKLASVIILNVDVTSEKKDIVLKYVVEKSSKRDEKFYIVTPNPEILMYAKTHPQFRAILNDARVALPDGVGVLMAGRIAGKSIIGRITGVDFMLELCSEYAKRPITIGFLGGMGGVAKMTAECLQKKHPTLKVVFAEDEWPTENKEERISNVDKKDQDSKSNIQNSKPIPHIDMLFVAFGFPKQEEWIAKNLERLPVTGMMAVGGAFDFIAGKIPRAPKMVRSIGMEWAFRLLMQPSRFKRQLALPAFVLEVLKERIRKK